MEFGLLLLRLIVGGTMAAHGAQKLFGSFGGYGLEGTGGWLESLGFKPGKTHATVTGVAEFGGGLLLAFGFLTPFAAAAIVGVMIVAIATVHWDKGFFNTEGGFEFNLVLIATALCLAYAGPGSASLDGALGLDLDGPIWGFTALLLGVMGAILALGVRESEPTVEVENASVVEEAPATASSLADKLSRTTEEQVITLEFDDDRLSGSSEAVGSDRNR